MGHWGDKQGYKEGPSCSPNSRGSFQPWTEQPRPPFLTLEKTVAGGDGLGWGCRLGLLDPALIWLLVPLGCSECEGSLCLSMGGARVLQTGGGIPAGQLSSTGVC